MIKQIPSFAHAEDNKHLIHRVSTKQTFQCDTIEERDAVIAQHAKEDESGHQDQPG